MREILFRGKQKRGGEWVYGYFFAKPILEKYFIIYGEEQWMVDPETIGQWTGLVDVNGVKIFEGDMLEPPDDEIEKFCVEFYMGSFVVVSYGIRGAQTENGWDETAGGYGLIEREPLNNYYIDQFEVIGNIHDKAAEE